MKLRLGERPNLTLPKPPEPRRLKEGAGLIDIMFWIGLIGALLNCLLMMAASSTPVLAAVVPIFAGSAILCTVGMIGNYLLARRGP